MAIKQRGRGLFIEKLPLTLGSNADLDFLLDLHMGLNLIQLNLRVDANL